MSLFRARHDALPTAVLSGSLAKILLSIKTHRCNSNAIETTQHVLLHCSYFITIAVNLSSFLSEHLPG